MYLAPMNYDRFFERTFKDLVIAKSFLEDVFGEPITELEMLARKNKLTDESALVEFDFRCKMNGKPTTIDMQQWYKTDVVKRFFMYFCNNTSLQLEDMKPVSIPLPNGKEYKTKDYNGLQSAITLIWMADDTMGYKEDMVYFSMFPELMNAFIRDEALWTNPDMDTLLKYRTMLLKVMDNNKKNLDFLSTNRLGFMLQPNIFKNQKMTKYLKWFEFAQKTKNPNNTAADFKKYSNDPILVKVMEKLKTNALSTDDFQYITDYQAHAIGVKNYNDMIAKEASDKIASFYKNIIERVEQDKLRMAQEFLTQQLRLVDKCLKRGDSLESIESFMEIDRATLNTYIEQLNSVK